MTTPEPNDRTPYNTPLPGSQPPAPEAPAWTEFTVPSVPTQEGPASVLASRETSKLSAMTVVALAVAGLSLLLGLIGVGVGVSAQARSAQLQRQMDDLQAQQAEVDGALAALDQRTGASLAEYLESLDARLSAAETQASAASAQADEAASSATFAEEYASSVGFRLDGVVECINSYMKTVGDSGGGYYRYYFC